MTSKLTIGKIIYEKDDIDLKERILRAAKEFENITKEKPNMAHVHPRHFGSGSYLYIKEDGFDILVVSDPHQPKRITYIGVGDR